MSDEVAAEAVRGLEWEVESLRLTALFPSGDLPNARELWTRVAAEEPEMSSEHKSGQTGAEGSFRNQKLSLTMPPGRVDWVYSLSPAETAERAIATACRLSDVEDIINQIVSKWTGSEDCPSFQRIALGLVLLCPTDSKESGYREIAEYLPAVDIDPDNSSDFSYQINRPRPCESLGALSINRLSKWSVAVFQTTTLALDRSGARSQGLPSHRTCACRLELDINTDNDFTGVLEPKQIEAIFGVLHKLAVELSQDGDRP